MHKHVFLCAVMTLLGLCGKAVAEDYLMPQYGYATKVVSKDAPLTFYDFKGASSHFTQSAFSTVIFQPATEGYSIKITFEELNLTRYSASYDVYLRIYNGQYDVTGTTYPTSGNPSGKFVENANQIGYIPNRIEQFAVAVGNSSFGIYLIHPLFLILCNHILLLIIFLAILLRFQ